MSECPRVCDHLTGYIDRHGVLLLFVFLGLHPGHMEVPGLGIKWELAYTTATATPDLSRVCNLHHNSEQRWILHPLSKARDRTCVLMDTSRVHYCWAMTGAPILVNTGCFCVCACVHYNFLRILAGFVTAEPQQELPDVVFFSCFLGVFFFWPCRSNRKLPNPSHRGDPNHSSDNTESLSTRPPGNSQKWFS